MTNMKVLLLSALAAVAVVDAATRVAVIEVGVGGAVRRTESKTAQTSVAGVASFWKVMHANPTGGGRKLQHAGMTVVPDLFRQADAGVVIGLLGSSVDLEEMPVTAGFVDEEGNNNGVIGHMRVEGTHCQSMMRHVDHVVQQVESIPTAATTQAQQGGLSGMTMTVDSSEKAAAVDAQLQQVIAVIDRQAKQDGKTVVIYLVVEEDPAASRRRALTTTSTTTVTASTNEQEQEKMQHRRLNDEADAEDDANANNGDGNSNGYAGYYGYGYYNGYGEWVTPYKTMFQIQYFNVVLWTAVGLTFTLFFTIFLMINMPLEADTLLFGESAKMVGDE
jgi:hypothetical protein